MEEVQKYSPEALNQDQLRKWNLEKYHMYSMVLEYIVDCRQITNTNVLRTNIVGMFKKQGIPANDEKLDAKVNAVLLQMAWMGLISFKGDYICIEADGVQAYKEQRYHEIAANLYNAEQTKKLSITAIWVASILSGISILSTIVIAILQQFH